MHSVSTRFSCVTEELQVACTNCFGVGSIRSYSLTLKITTSRNALDIKNKELQASDQNHLPSVFVYWVVVAGFTSDVESTLEECRKSRTAS